MPEEEECELSWAVDLLEPPEKRSTIWRWWLRIMAAKKEVERWYQGRHRLKEEVRELRPDGAIHHLAIVATENRDYTEKEICCHYNPAHSA